MALDLFKLQRLKIISYEKQDRQGSGTSFEVMFNPDSISMKHDSKYSGLQGINTKGRSSQYAYSRNNLRLDLILDGTGVTDFGVVGMKGKSVADQIEQFLKICFRMDGNIHQPRFLKIQWGTGVLKDFDCRLQTADVEYKLFDQTGAPLHAILKTHFIEDNDPEKRVRQEGKKSSDLSHVRVVKNGDTLPLLSKEIYGSSRYYLRVAQVNGIDDFRNLKPGQQIIFPPLDKEHS